LSSAGDKTTSALLPSQGAPNPAPEEFSVEAHPVDNDERPSAASPEVPPIELKTNDLPGPSPAEPGEDEAAPLRTKPLPKVNAAAREVPVRVTGAKAGSASEERDLFSELTATVMVFEKGGVIRLTAAVTRGQLLFLSNEESKREVVTQVIHKRASRPTECYVELEFTEPAPGFWGTEFSAATALLPKDAKLIAAAEMIASAETTDDELDENTPPPSAEQVEALKREVEALRGQLNLLQTQPEPAKMDSTVAVPNPPPVLPPDLSTPKPQAPTYQTEKIAWAELTADAFPAEGTPKPDRVPPPDRGLPPQPKPAMVFRKSLPPRKRSFRARGQFTPGFRTGMLRLAILSSILAGLIGTAWYKGWIPGIHQPKKIPVSSWAGGVTTPLSALPASPEKSAPKTKLANNVPLSAKGTAPGTNLLGDASTKASENDKGGGSAAHVVVVEKPPVQEKTAPAISVAKSPPVYALPMKAVHPVASSPSGSGFTPPRLIKSERAAASLDDLHDFETGDVVIDAIIDTEGNVTSTRVLSGPPSLRWPALQALKNYKYEPARQNGQPVAAHVSVKIKFHFE
jgi:periplasmic protein TonB